MRKGVHDLILEEERKDRLRREQESAVQLLRQHLTSASLLAEQLYGAEHELTCTVELALASARCAGGR